MPVVDPFSVKVEPGHKRWFSWATFDMPYGTPLEVPVMVAVGTGEGPTVYICGGTHGDEYNGMEAVRQFCCWLDPVKLRGRVIGVPVQNLAAFLYRQRVVPWDGYDLNRQFPGGADGWPAERLADRLYQVIRRADCVLDLHTAMAGGRCIPHIFIPPDHAKGHAPSLELAKVFGVDMVVKMKAGTSYEGFVLDRTLHVVAGLDGIPTLCVELGEAGRLEQPFVAIGMRGITNCLRKLGMLDGEPELERQPVVVDEQVTVRAETAGFLTVIAALGSVVDPGQPLARLVSIPDQEALVVSPVKGLLGRIQTAGVAFPGDRVAVLGRLA